MQIKVHDVKNQKKEIREEIGMLQKRLFYCLNCEIRLRSVVFLRQGYLRMSQQCDLPESMTWRVIGRLESGQTQRSVADAVGVARSCKKATSRLSIIFWTGRRSRQWPARDLPLPNWMRHLYAPIHYTTFIFRIHYTIIWLQHFSVLSG
ncbi:hypothetical protein TNCV_4218761 [Trichonephila clavipes]|nr:hypothetical protein TNCV_4218761 [Trichonephila clavipes]